MTETGDLAAPDSDRIDELAEANERLTAAVIALDDSVQASERATQLKLEALRKADRRRAWLTGLTSVLVVLCMVGIVVGLVVLKTDYATRQDQQATRVRVLCPLYAFAVTQLDLVNQSALPADKQKVFAEELQVFRTGYANLGCTPSPTTSTAAPG